MKTLLLLLVLAGSKPYPTTTAAYICTGAKKYHLSSKCRGLSSCQHKIIKMSLTEAQKSGRTLCGWEN
jgi:hypothetical protein